MSSQVIAANGDFTASGGFGAVFNQVDSHPASTPGSACLTAIAGATAYSFDLLDLSLDFHDADQI